MSLKQEIETWVQALGHYDNNEFEESLKTFDNIADTSKILFNCGVIHATLGEHDKAVECYRRAVRLDQYLAVAYFQQGVSNFLVGDFEEALANFNDTLLYLRGNTYIDYEQLGLKFRLYSCEVLFNRGLCYIYLQQSGPGMQDFQYAVKEKVTPDHDVIDDAIREKAEGYTVFSIPVGVVYRPNEAKVKNLKTKDYLGKARLVAASDRSNAFTGFAGTEIKKSLTPDAGKDDRPAEAISFAATNLVHKNLGSRARQQSEPPINRNMFPPTPPPEMDKPASIASNGSSGSGPPGMTGRTASVRNGRAAPPPRLDEDLRGGPMGRSMGGPMDGPMDRGMGGMRGPADTMRGMDGMRGWLMDGMRGGPMDGMRSMEGMRGGPMDGFMGGPNKMSSTPMGRPRLGTARTASEPRGPPSRQYSMNRGRDGAPLNRPPLFRETTDQRRRNMNQPTGFEPVAGDGYDDAYDMYSSPRSSRGMRRTGSRMQQQRPRYIDIEEEEEYASEAYEDDSLGEEGEFEMMGGAQVPLPLRNRRPSQSRATSRRPEIRKIRVKVHAGDDTRYIMIGPAAEFGDFEARIREKFGIKTRLKIKMQDDGDMITMGDQDDLDMLISSAKQVARKERNEMGKMEIWAMESR